MNTAWGEIPVTDAHVHFFSHAFFSTLSKQKGDSMESVAKILGWEMPGEQPEDLAARWVEELDRNAVARAGLIASIPGDENSVAAAVSRFPDRFYGCFMLNPIAPDALTRTQSAIAGGWLQVISLFPAMHRYSMHDDRLRPILDLATS